MKLITDTYISKDHFREVPSDPDFVAFQCGDNELPIMHLNLCEWARQLEQEMRVRNKLLMVPMVEMSRGIIDVVEQHATKITELPDDILKEFYNITTAFSRDFKAEMETRGIE